MTTIATSPLNDALQALVDARLDTIDRMLLGRVNRQDRLAIVREVESQIFDLIQGHDGGPPDRDDMLAILARLDPPEAYLPDEDSPSGARPPQASVAPRAVPPPIADHPGRLALAAGVLGIVSVTIVLFCLSLEFGDIDPTFLFFAAAALSFITCTLAIIFAAKVRLRGPWAIVGLVTGILSMLGFLGYGLAVLMDR